MSEKERLLEALCHAARGAGDVIMRHYQQGGAVSRKQDKSPVTEADVEAGAYIDAALAEVAPDIHVISEEHASHALPAGTTRFFLVDPLDGTRSFIRGDGQFTVNIGLIENGVPTLGVIYIPVEQVLYAGVVGAGAFKEDHAGRRTICTRVPLADGLDAVVSHSHLDPQTEDFLRSITVRSRVSAASSLKFCRVAEGVADVYPRFGPTMEWDTAAGHAILLAAGGVMTKPDGSAFEYGKADFKNGAFVVWGAAQ